MRSIRTKLTLIIIATSVLAVALVGVSARWITHSQFTTLRLEQTNWLPLIPTFGVRWER